MPTYQYACTTCGERLEVVQTFADDPLTECPSCSGRLRKLFSPVGVVFKGSGFYRNDSRTGGGKPARGGAGSEQTAADTKPAENTKTERKPAESTSTTSASPGDSGKVA